MNKVLTAVMLLAGSAVAQASVLPPTPVPFKYGTGVMDNQVIYIGLGSAGKAWYRLDTTRTDSQWEPVAAFPGEAREQATSVVVDGRIYVFGGTGKNEAGQPRVFNDVWMYTPSDNRWQKLMTHSPSGLTGHVALVHDGQVILTGGVNQNIFDGYFDDIAAAKGNKSELDKINRDYFSKPARDYFYNRQILSFDPVTLQWHNAGELPSGGLAGATPVTEGNRLFLINGEVKPGLRTDAVYAGTFQGQKIRWTHLPPVMSPDGVAGGFGGVSGDTVILAGGAGFRGSRARYEQGKYWAHQGLSKYYSNDIHVYQQKRWMKAGQLPEGLAYGVSLPWKDGLLMIGGEKTGGKAVSDSVWLGVRQGVLTVKQ
ncbi:TPA: YjhT family mutarotase [Klebsiella oxytoca]|uniref:YjhT family mutarotase n=1 Tax=Klebsiella oxytoca TaxID=571 RepID=A0AAN5LBT3_KLEOX|nr:YjhT family mutarotase [Klebsiella oxytoca]